MTKYTNSAIRNGTLYGGSEDMQQMATALSKDVADTVRPSVAAGRPASDTGTLTRADLADVLHREIGISRADASAQVEAILRFMCGALSDGENVKISGFGSFILRDKGERIGRNPKTGVEVPIAPRRVLTFRASQTMRERIVAAR